MGSDAPCAKGRETEKGEGLLEKGNSFQGVLYKKPTFEYSSVKSLLRRWQWKSAQIENASPNSKDNS